MCDYCFNETFGVQWDDFCLAGERDETRLFVLGLYLIDRIVMRQDRVSRAMHKTSSLWVFVVGIKDLTSCNLPYIIHAS